MRQGTTIALAVLLFAILIAGVIQLVILGPLTRADTGPHGPGYMG